MADEDYINPFEETVSLLEKGQKARASGLYDKVVEEMGQEAAPDFKLGDLGEDMGKSVPMLTPEEDRGAFSEIEERDFPAEYLVDFEDFQPPHVTFGPSVRKENVIPSEYSEGHDERGWEWNLVDMGSLPDVSPDDPAYEKPFQVAFPYQRFYDDGSPAPSWQEQFERFREHGLVSNLPERIRGGHVEGTTFTPYDYLPKFYDKESAKAFTRQANVRSDKPYIDPFTGGYLPEHLAQAYFKGATGDEIQSSVNWDDFMKKLVADQSRSDSDIPGWGTLGGKLLMHYLRGPGSEWFNPEKGKDYPRLGVYHGMKPHKKFPSGLPVFERDGKLMQHETPTRSKEYISPEVLESIVAPLPVPEKKPGWNPPGRIFNR